MDWLAERYRTRTSAPVEKSRDSGATWMACVFAVWLWLFQDGSTSGFGSRKEILVDRQGDMQSIFEKIRTIIRRLPHYLLPRGFKPEVHLNYMRILNPEIDTSIIGEAGDNIGRGGRGFVERQCGRSGPGDVGADRGIHRLRGFCKSIVPR